jgi:hypothetical protein
VQGRKRRLPPRREFKVWGQTGNPVSRYALDQGISLKQSRGYFNGDETGKPTAGAVGFRQPRDGHPGLRPVIIAWRPSVRRFPEAVSCVFFLVSVMP